MLAAYYVYLVATPGTSMDMLLVLKGLLNFMRFASLGLMVEAYLLSRKGDWQRMAVNLALLAILILLGMWWLLSD